MIENISLALNSIKTAIDIARLISESGTSLEKAELKLKLAEILDALADAKIEITGFQSLLSEKDERIRELEEAFALKEKLVKKGDAYYGVDEHNAAAGDPYCLHCWETDHKPIHLHQAGGGEKEGYFTVCSVCKNKYAPYRTERL